jgi:hypothetical protein
VAVQARTLVVLQLEQLEQADLFAGRRHHSQLASGIGEEDAGGVDVEQLDAAVGQHREQVDDVELSDEGVGELDERLRYELLPPTHACRSTATVTIRSQGLRRCARLTAGRGRRAAGVR